MRDWIYGRGDIMRDKLQTWMRIGGCGTFFEIGVGLEMGNNKVRTYGISQKVFYTTTYTVTGQTCRL